MIWAVKDAPVADVEERAVLSQLSEEADESGCGAGISVPTIAERTRLDEQTVRRRIHDMLDRRLLALGDQSIVAYIRADRRPAVYDLLIPYSGFASVARVNRERARKGLPLLTPENRPDIAPPPPLKPRADKGARRGRRRPAAADRAAAPATSTDNGVSDSQVVHGVSDSQVVDATTYLPDIHGVSSNSARPIYKGGDPRATTNPEDQTLPPPPTPLTTGALRAVPDPEGGEGDQHDPDITPGQRPIIDAVLAERPGWRPADVAAAMNRALQNRPHARDVIPLAIVALARGDYDRGGCEPTLSPARLLANGPWWGLRPDPGAAAEDRPGGGTRCPTHPWSVDNRVGACRWCRSETLAADDNRLDGGLSAPEPAQEPAARPLGRAERAAAVRAAIRPNRYGHVRRNAPRPALPGPPVPPGPGSGGAA